MKPGEDAAQVRLRHPQLHRKAAANRQDQCNHQRLNIAETAVLEQQHDHHVQGRDDAAPDQRDPKKQLEADRGADDFRQVARCNGQLAEDPEEIDRRARIVVATRLREIPAGGDAQLDAQVLEQDRHQVRDHDDGQERVAKLRAARQVGGPVARVHVADRHEKTRTREGEHLPPERRPGWHRDAAVHLREALRPTPPPPAGVAGGRQGEMKSARP